MQDPLCTPTLDAVAERGPQPAGESARVDAMLRHAAHRGRSRAEQRLDPARLAQRDRLHRLRREGGEHVESAAVAVVDGDEERLRLLEPAVFAARNAGQEAGVPGRRREGERMQGRLGGPMLADRCDHAGRRMRRTRGRRGIDQSDVAARPHQLPRDREPEDAPADDDHVESRRYTHRVLLSNAQLYVCTDARRDRGDFADFVDAAFDGGVDIVQLRDKSLEAAEELEFLDILRGVAERHGRLWAVNDRADIAAAAGAPVLHLGQGDLPRAHARRILGDHVVLGLSTHDTAQLVAARTEDDLGYFCVGPVWATPTKPGRPGVGLDLVRAAADADRTAGVVRPWFAIGGIDHDTVDDVVAAGATRIVVVRAVTDAEDPAGAARRLRERLPSLR